MIFKKGILIYVKFEWCLVMLVNGYSYITIKY